MRVFQAASAASMRNTSALVILVGVLAASGLFAYPQQEVKPEAGKAVIGAVYTDLSAGYYFEGIYYQSLDQAVQRSITEIARQEGFGLREVEGGSRPNQINTAVDSLINAKVDGIVLSLQQPISVSQSIDAAHRAGIPVVVRGVKTYPELQAPFVSDDALDTGRALGVETARVFRKRFPEQTAHIVIANTRAVERSRLLEEGFLSGFGNVIPDPEVIDLPDDNGSVMNVQEIVLAELYRHPEANVFFGTSDLRTEGIVLALLQSGRNSIETELVASVGGTVKAMNRLLEPESPWKVEAGYSITGQVEKSYQVLSEMMKGEIPIDSRTEILVDSVILAEPTLQEVRAYLKDHQGLQSFSPQQVRGEDS
jgi:ABC-type sugar transport system substrate-binding protein